MIRRKEAEIERARVEREAEAIRDRCRTLKGFIREAWHVLEPETPYDYCWHHAAIAEHLEAVHTGEITRLQINQPPGTAKSLTCSVMFQPFEWGPKGKAGLRYFTTSYQEGYARRDSRKSRDLIMSEWYRALWPEIDLVRDGEADFENTKHGYRKAVAFSALTAGRGNRVIIDDPHSTDTAESEQDRMVITRRFRESVPSRLNDQRTDAIIVIMHRLHPKDVCGVIDELGLPYTKLILPMEFDPKVYIPSRYFDDPRVGNPGELLCPERMPREVIDNLKTEYTPHAWAGQYQQQPTNREGGLFKRHSFQFVDAIPAEALNNQIRHWDLAATVPKPGRDPDWTVGLKMCSHAGRFYIMDIVRLREPGWAVRVAIKNTAVGEGRKVKIHIPIDPGQAGVDQSQSIIAENAGYIITADKETGDKGTRAEPFAAQMAAGNVFLLRAHWNEEFIEELCSFPAGSHDDQVDAAAGAFNKLAQMPPVVEISDEELRMASQGRRRY